MIRVSEAKELIYKYGKASVVKELPLLETLGCILAEDVTVTTDTPPFDQSAMDGYAFSFEGWDQKSPLTLVGEIQTGTVFPCVLKPNEAVRIFTGAPIPSAADSVVMQEKVLADNDSIRITDKNLFKGSNVRPRGSQTKKGSTALQKGQLLTPAGLSYLSGMGISKVQVYSKPRVSIIVTGKELVKAGEPISEGKIYESNSTGLVAALQQLHIHPHSVELVDDVEEDITRAINRQLHTDILILTGGVSVGDYDLVPACMEKCGVKKVFHKVRQRPGKPFLFGSGAQTLVFALPGNPAAVMSCFYEYVVPAISKFTQRDYFKSYELPLANAYTKKVGLTYFLKGKIEGDRARILDSQLSYLLDSFAVADCLITLDEGKEAYQTGDPVKVTMIL